MSSQTRPTARDTTAAFVSWLVTGAVGPALIALPVNLVADKLAGAAALWFKRFLKTDDLSRLVKAAAGTSIDLSNAEFKALRKLLENEQTWTMLAGGKLEEKAQELTEKIARCLPPRDGRTELNARQAADAIARGLLEFAAFDLQPEIFQRVALARLQQMSDQTSALDKALFRIHEDLYHFVDEARDLVKLVSERLPRGAAGPGEISVYLNTLIDWLDFDPWPQDRRLGGPMLRPATIERKLRVSLASSPHGRELEIDADELTRRCGRLVLLGEPGSGKTWLAKRAVRQCAQAALEALTAGTGLNEIELPLYTTCARLSATQPSEGIRRAVVLSAIGQLPDLGGSRVTDALRALFEERNAPTLLVADSLDEANGADDRIRQADTLPSSWRILLTSRPASWNHQIAIDTNDPSRRVGVLQSLSYPDDIEAFIGTWFQGRPAWALDLSAQLRARPALQRAATVPLILAFYCIVAGDQPLPTRRAELYSKVIRRLLAGRWRGSSERDPDPEACVEILRDWAWSAADADPVSGVGAWADDFHTSRVRRSQDDRDALDHVALPLGPSDADSGMTQRRFIHRSLREHLAAEHIALRMPIQDAAAELINHLWYDPDWEYTVPSAIAMHPQRDQLLKDLICRVTGGDRLPIDLSTIDACWEIRKLLARVAQESGEHDWSPEAAQMIGQARLDLASSQGTLDLLTTTEWPASTGLIIEKLLRILATETRIGPIWRLLRMLTQLAVTSDEWDQAWKGLIGLLARTNPLPTAPLLAVAVGWLTKAAEDQARARREVVELLVRTTDESTILGLAEVIGGLDPATAERAEARKAVLELLSTTTNFLIQEQLWKVVTKFAVTADDRTQTRRALLQLLATKTQIVADNTVSDCFNQLAVTAEDRTYTRTALLQRLATADVFKASPLAQAAGGLDPTAQEQGQVRKRLLQLLTTTTNVYAASSLAEAISGQCPTAQDRAQARSVLLQLLIRTTDVERARRLAEAIPRLAVTAEEQVSTEEALLAIAADSPFYWTDMVLPGVVAQLAVAAEEQSQALQALLGWLATGTNPPTNPALTDAITRLVITAKDRAPAMKTLLGQLTRTTAPSIVAMLAKTLGTLNPSADEQTKARRALLELLATATDYFAAAELAEAVGTLNPNADEQAEARRALLGLLGTATDYFAVCELAEAVGRLNPAAEDRATTGERLLQLLATISNAYFAPRLAKAIGGLDLATEDRAQAVKAVLELLTRTTNPKIVSELAAEITKLAVTAADRATARGRLLKLLATTTDRSIAPALADTVIALNPTAADLDGSHSWRVSPSPKLLAAVRRNSVLSAWLKVCRTPPNSLASQRRRDGSSTADPDR